MCPLVDDYWVSRYYPWQHGAVNPTNPYINSSIVLTYRELFKLVYSISSPSFLDSLNRFFSDASNAISTIKMFPFVIPRLQTGPIWYLTSELTYDNSACTGGYLDRDFIEHLYAIFNQTLGETPGDPSWYETNGYSKVFVYLPFYGEIELPATDVINKQVKVYYSVSETGELMYFITVTRDIDSSQQNERLIAKYSTNIAVDIPIGSSNLHAVNRNLAIQLATGAVSIASIVALGATGGVVSTSAGVAALTTNTSDVSESFARGDQPYSKIKRVSETTHTTSVTSNSNFSSSTKIPSSKLIIEGCSAAASSSLNALQNFCARSTSEITKSANLEQFGPRRVIVTVYSPIMHEDNHAHYCGLPLAKEDVVSNYSGFTKLSAFHLENFNSSEAAPTLSEINMLEDILIDGFIIRAVDAS